MAVVFCVERKLDPICLRFSNIFLFQSLSLHSFACASFSPNQRLFQMFLWCFSQTQPRAQAYRIHFFPHSHQINGFSPKYITLIRQSILTLTNWISISEEWKTKQQAFEIVMTAVAQTARIFAYDILRFSLFRWETILCVCINKMTKSFLDCFEKLVEQKRNKKTHRRLLFELTRDVQNKIMHMAIIKNEYMGIMNR